MNLPTNLPQLLSVLRQRGPELARLPVVAGFDGFVDEMISVVDERQSLDAFRAVPDLTAFSRIVAGAAGRSSLREIVVHRRDAGGCAVNLGDGIATLGVPLRYFGTIGTPMVPAFADFAAKCKSCTPWGREPGRTMALEFGDGKLMLCSVSQLAEFTPDLLRGCLADGAFTAACAEAKAICITNWTLYPHMTACWRYLRQAVFAGLSHRPLFFFDLVDPSARSQADITAMLAELREFSRHGRAVLGLNGNEGNVIARLLGLPTQPEEPSAVIAQAVAIRERLGIDEVVIHGVKLAASADATGSASAPGPYCATPKKLTGAGDRFNAGWVAGAMLGLPAADRLLLGNLTSGSFVRTAASGTVADLIALGEAWQAGRA
jgi:hypothetical protein